MSESFDAVEFRPILAANPQKQDIRLQLDFTQGLHPKPTDQVLIMTVGWKNLDERISSIRTNGSSTVTFCATQLARDSPHRADKAFQFLYIQENSIVGVSHPFTPGADEPEQEAYLSEDQETLSGGNGRHPNKLGWSPLDVREPLQIKEEADDELWESTSGAAGATPQDRPDTNLWRSAEAFFSHVHYIPTGEIVNEKSCKKRNGRSVESFVVVAMPSGQALTEYTGGEHALLDEAVRERDKLAKMYDREKNVAFKQGKRNEELQTAYDEVEEDNRQLKESLREVESQILALKAKKARESIVRAPSNPKSSTETLASASHVRREHTSCDDKALSKNGGDGTLSLTMSERSSLFTEVLSCPVCNEAFDKTQGATQFQRHVHGHFAEEDEWLL